MVSPIPTQILCTISIARVNSKIGDFPLLSVLVVKRTKKGPKLPTGNKNVENSLPLPCFTQPYKKKPLYTHSVSVEQQDKYYLQNEAMPTSTFL